LHYYKRKNLKTLAEGRVDEAQLKEMANHLRDCRLFILPHRQLHKFPRELECSRWIPTDYRQRICLRLLDEGLPTLSWF